MASIQIRKELVITNLDTPKLLWKAKLEVVDGVELVSISSSDRGFQRLVQLPGVAIEPWLAKLKKQRQDKTFECATAGSVALFGKVSNAVRIEQRKQCMRMMETGSLPNLIVLDLLPFEYNGNHIDGVKARCKTSVELKAPICVEASPFVLEYIKFAVIASTTDASDEHAKRRRTYRTGEKYVYWRSKAKCFVARRTEGEGEHKTYKYKTFKPEDESDDIVHECQQKAERWAEGADDDDDDNDEGQAVIHSDDDEDASES